MGLIKRAELKNTLILALVIAFCIALIVYFHGVKPVLQATASSQINDSIAVVNASTFLGNENQEPLNQHVENLNNDMNDTIKGLNI